MSDLIELTHRVSNEFNGILRANLYELSLTEEELVKVRRRKRELRTALKNCGIGDENAKSYIKTCIRDILTKKIMISSENIDSYIPFNVSAKLSCRDKFDILIYSYMKEYKADALSMLIDDYEMLSNENNIYVINEEQIEKVYEKAEVYLSFFDKLEVLTQRIYADYKGLGVVDDIRDMAIDGVSGGVSGKEGEYNSVWIFFRGRMVHLSFLSFDNENELSRICMNIYRYGYPGQFSMARGYIVNEMKDHSRVVVVRPPFSESFAFFVRKFTTIENKDTAELIVDKGAEKAISVLKYLVKGCMVTGITGAQGSGKTTLLMSLIRYIHPSYTLRIQEMAFELHLREIYPERNILTFRETDTVKGQDALDLQKKTDGTVNILGEVASAPVSSWLVQMSMVGSLFTMFTHHAKTTKALVKYMRNCLLSTGAFSNEVIAEEQVVDAINFDVHMEKDISGKRYIERITEIVPIEDYDSRKLYDAVDIVRYEEGEYRIVNNISSEHKRQIFKYLSHSEQEEYSELFGV